MIITTSIIAAVAAIQFTTSMVVALMAGSAAIGGIGAGVGVYFLKPGVNKKELAELAELRKESLLRQKRLQTATEALVTNALSSSQAIATTAGEIQGHLQNSTQAFQKEIEVTGDANLKLVEIVTLLQRICDSTQSKAQPLIDEVKRRLDELHTRNQALEATKNSLTKTERMLQESVAKHAATQKHLENAVRASSTKIDELTHQFDQARALMKPQQVQLKIKEAALRRAHNVNKSLVAKMDEFKAQIVTLTTELQATTAARQSQNSKIRALLTKNQELDKRIHDLVHELEEKNAATSRSSSPKTHEVTMFRRCPN